MNIALICTDSSGSSTTLSECVRFSLVCERYVPDARLDLTVRAGQLANLPVDTVLQIDGRQAFRGWVLSAQNIRENGMDLLRLHARGYPALLLRNQLTPGVHYDVTLQSLLEAYPLPHISYQDVPETINYVYVKEHTALWDAVIAYNYKRSRGYPFVRMTGMVCVRTPDDQRSISLDEKHILSVRSGCDHSGMISRIEMADIDGTYGTFVLDNPEALRRGIISVRQMPFDRQFLHDPTDSLRLRIACGNRRMRSRTVRYLGWCGEDVCDTLSADGISGEIGRVVITGDAKGIATADTLYFDDFCNREG
ncbi:MAG TPA: hypothetical protein DDX71_06350 [Ruminococcus sp.]|nr:hypothetical protein [Ruminococcus sp.]